MNKFDKLLREKAEELARRAEKDKAIAISIFEVLKRSDAYSKGRFQLRPGSKGITSIRDKAANICSYRVEAGKVVISTMLGGDGISVSEAEALAEIAELIVKHRRVVESQQAGEAAA
jgi:hypothetical protein